MAKRITTLSGLMLFLLSMSTIYSSVYGDSFLCPEVGSFRKRDSCREYYTCISFNGKFYQLLEKCADSEIFDDAERTCVLNSHLSSPHDCLRGSHSEEDSTEDHVEEPTETLERNNNLDSMGISYTSPKRWKQAIDIPGTESDDGSTLDEATKDAHPQQLDKTTKDVVRQQLDETTKDAHPQQLDQTTKDVDVVPQQLDETTKDAHPQQLDQTTKDVDVVPQQLDETTKDAHPQQLDETTKDAHPQQLDETTKDAHPQQLNETTKDVVPEQPNVAVDANVKILSLCDLKNITDAYFTLVIGSSPLRQVSGNQTVYNRNIMQYNRDITQAHDNSNLWRRSNGIPRGLRQSHKKANEYKNDFQRKLAIYKEQIQIISSRKTSPAFIQRLEEEIKDHDERIRRAQATLNVTLVPEIIQILEQTIDANMKEIERKKLQKNPNSELLLLRELVTFVTLVKNDASEVENLARQTLRKITRLLEKMSTDEHNYAKLDDQANKGIKTLTEEAASIRQELTRNAKLQEELVTDRKTVGEKLGDLRIEYSKIKEDIRVITKTIDDFIAKKNIICTARRLAAYVGLDVTCDTLIRSMGITFDLETENNRLEELRREQDMIQANQSIALEELQTPTPIRMALADEILPKNRRLELIEFELYNLQFYAAHLQELKNGAAAARDSILYLQEDSRGLLKNFESLVKKLQDMADAANTAITDGIQTGKREMVENDLEILLITLQNQKLNNINECFTI
ncbi:uncharacterized protein LOC135226591 [Macrobrachium nipponense]|uniref:uncharacterized protein LOC135226591 n=1 Tax=Macrobrachium nipponense TaxID=159736 RepID=UPI0030C7D9D6